MVGEVFYLFRARRRLRERVQAKPSEIGSLICETILWKDLVGRPEYPPSEFDPALYAKVVFLAYLTGLYGGDPDYDALWEGNSPTSVEEFDELWTLEVLGHENLSDIEIELTELSEGVRAIRPTGNAEVDETLLRLAGGSRGPHGSSRGS